MSRAKRKYPRRAFSKVIGVLHHGQYCIARAQVIGEGGISLHCDQAYQVGDELVVNFQIPNGDFVSIRSEIRSITAEDSRYQMGLLFKNIAFSNKRQIRAFVSARTDAEDALIAS